MTGFRRLSPLPRLANMAQQASAARAVDVTAMVGAAAVLLAVLALIASSFLVGVAQEAWRSLAGSSSSSCSSGASTALTSEREVACIPPGTRTPQGWTVIARSN